MCKRCGYRIDEHKLRKLCNRNYEMFAIKYKRDEDGRCGKCDCKIYAHPRISPTISSSLSADTFKMPDIKNFTPFRSNKDESTNDPLLWFNQARNM